MASPCWKTPLSSGWEGTDGKVSHAVLGNDNSVEADLVVAGIGVTPNEALARQAGSRVWQRYRG